ncbi:MAG: N-acetyl-D-Glu racemase DgcA [Kordiimonas sp.]
MRRVTFFVEAWQLREPFVITGHTFTVTEVLLVQIEEDGIVGRGEATGVYYLGETGASMLADAEKIKDDLAAGSGRAKLQQLLPAGGARNAIDCALWDLEVKKAGSSIWESVGFRPTETITVNTVSIGTPNAMAVSAKGLNTSKIKVKLNGDMPLERIAAVIEARPDAEVVVDVNQGWTFKQLVDLAPKFRDLGVKMIEQPLPRGSDDDLEGYDAPLPICADESCLHTGELEAASRKYSMINIKLDKTGGLTEALALAKAARAKGLGLMVGNMTGTSLGMAPAYVVAQLCDFVDLDGALFLKDDRPHAMFYDDGFVGGLVPELWG